MVIQQSGRGGALPGIRPVSHQGEDGVDQDEWCVTSLFASVAVVTRSRHMIPSCVRRYQ